MGLSICVLTFNGADKLHRCLSSLYEHCDQLVVCVDNRTADASRDIARKYTQHVHDIAFDHWGQARDAMIERASEDWILQIDDDEDISREDAMFMRTFCATAPPDVDLYMLARRNWADLNKTQVYRHPIDHGSKYLFTNIVDYPDYQWRMFRNVPYIRYGNMFAHAIPSGANKIGVAPFTINHYRMAYVGYDWIEEREKMYDQLFQKYADMDYTRFVELYASKGLGVMALINDMRSQQETPESEVSAQDAPQPPESEAVESSENKDE